MAQQKAGDGDETRHEVPHEVSRASVDPHMMRDHCENQQHRVELDRAEPMQWSGEALKVVLSR